MIEKNHTKKYNRSQWHFILAAAIFTVTIAGMPWELNARTGMDGTRTACRYDFRDRKEYATKDFDDTRLPEALLPGTIHRKSGNSGILWIRCRLDARRRWPENSTLILDRRASAAYMNGIRLKESDGLYGRGAMFMVPAKAIASDYNLLTLRFILKRNIAGENLIFRMKKPSMQILNASAAQQKLFAADAKALAFAGTFVLIAILSLLMCGGRDRGTGFLLFASFSFSLFLIATSETILYRLYAGTHVFFLWIETVLYAIAPAIWFIFFRSALKLKFFRLELLYPATGFAIASVAIALTGSGKFGAMIVDLWGALHLIALIYCLKAGASSLYIQRSLKSLILTGTAAFIFFRLSMIILPRFGIGSTADSSPLNDAIIVHFLSFAALIAGIAQQAPKDFKNRRKKKASGAMQALEYLRLLLGRTSEEAETNLIQINANPTKTKMRKLVANLDSLNQQMSNSLSDTLLLISLENRDIDESHPPSNPAELIAGLPNIGQFTHYTSIRSDVRIQADPEILGLLIERLAGFSEFPDFSHVDLIVTSDETGSVFFRFLLYGRETRSVRELYDSLLHDNSENPILRIRWRILEELSRLLEGETTVQPVGHRFLRIELRIGGNITSRNEKEAARFPEVRSLSGSSPELNRGTSSKQSHIPVFSPNMSLSEFAHFLKDRIGRS